jgi:hypothetical protein
MQTKKLIILFLSIQYFLYILFVGLYVFYNNDFILNVLAYLFLFVLLFLAIPIILGLFALSINSNKYIS